MSEQLPGQGWARGLGREQYPPSYGAVPSGQPSYQVTQGQPSYQATQGQPPWETPPPGPEPSAGPSAPPSGPAAGRAAPGPGGHGTRASAAHEAGAGAGQSSGAAAGSGHASRQRPQLPLEESRNFLNALFDFGFTSFVTPKVVKVLYLLIVVVVGLSALAFAVTMLASNLVLGLIVLLIGAPLYFLVVTALYRITLEFFMVIFRMAEDIRALRERGEIR